MENQLQAWQNPDEIRRLFAPTLSEPEFQFFMGLGKNLNANPFTREIWAVKYGTGPASIFCGRDFYRKKAQEQSDYDGHYVEAVYSNDDFAVENGEVKHKFKLTDRGVMIAAYCVVKKKNVSLNYFGLVQLAEYNTNQSNWKTKPETMIKKVAESQGLRAAFQGIFEGTYDESEEFKVQNSNGKSEDATLMITPDLKNNITDLITSELISETERRPVLNKIDRFTFVQATKCLEWLKMELKAREDQLKKEAEEAQQ